MQQRISLREANQRLSRYVAAVERGGEFVITRRGRPVARLVPVEGCDRLSATREAALQRTRERMRLGYPLGGGPVSREELHSR